MAAHYVIYLKEPSEVQDIQYRTIFNIWQRYKYSGWMKICRWSVLISCLILYIVKLFSFLQASVDWSCLAVDGILRLDSQPEHSNSTSEGKWCTRKIIRFIECLINFLMIVTLPSMWIRCIVLIPHLRRADATLYKPATRNWRKFTIIFKIFLNGKNPHIITYYLSP